MNLCSTRCSALHAPCYGHFDTFPQTQPPQESFQFQALRFRKQQNSLEFWSGCKIILILWIPYFEKTLTEYWWSGFSAAKLSVSNSLRKGRTQQSSQTLQRWICERVVHMWANLLKIPGVFCISLRANLLPNWLHLVAYLNFTLWQFNAPCGDSGFE